MKKYRLLFFSLLFLSGNMFAQKSIDKLLEKHNTKSVPYISVTEARMLQSQNKALILDSREEKEYKVSHVKNAYNVGYDHFNIQEFEQKYPEKDTTIIVYCSVGIRSEDIGEKLQQAGYTKVKNIYGGIFLWKEKDFPVVDSTQTETQNIHTFDKIWGKYLKKGKKVY